MPTRTEIDFIAAWRACAVDGVLDPARLHTDDRKCMGLVVRHATALTDTHSVTVATFDAQLRESVRASRVWTLNPAGEDLIRTADAIDFDPATALADDEPKPASDEPACSECGDSGEVVVIGNFKNPCACCGFGDVDARVRTALDEHRRARLHSPLVFGVDLASAPSRTIVQEYHACVASSLDSSALSHYLIPPRPAPGDVPPSPEDRERDALLRTLDMRKRAKTFNFSDNGFAKLDTASREALCYQGGIGPSSHFEDRERAAAARELTAKIDKLLVANASNVVDLPACIVHKARGHLFGKSMHLRYVGLHPDNPEPVAAAPRTSQEITDGEALALLRSR